MKYILKQTITLIPKNRIFLHLKSTRIKFDNSIEELFSKGFIDTTKTDIILKPKGKEYFDKINNDNDELIIEDIYEDYDFAVIKFLYYNDWGVKSNEFPQLFKALCKREIIEDYFTEWAQFIKCDEHSNYRLNDEGKRHFVLRNKQKENKKNQLENPTTVNNFTGNQIGNLHTGNVAGDLNQTFLREDLAIPHPTNEPIAPQTNIMKKIWGWFINNPMSAAILGGIIAMIAGTLILKHYHVI